MGGTHEKVGCGKFNNLTTNVWIDHCTFSDGDSALHSGTDGLLDITRGSDYITISYCKFFNHDKSILIGHVDGEDSDKGKLRTTLHHNWFNGTIQRHPRVRQGEVHVYNNYYVANSIYGIVSANNAMVLVEGNYFIDVPIPTQLGVPGFSGPGDLLERNNIYVNCGTPASTGKAFDVTSYYQYTADAAASIPATVMAKAGAGSIRTVNIKQNQSLQPSRSNLNNYGSIGSTYFYDISGKQITPRSNSSTKLTSKGVYFGVQKSSSKKVASKTVNVK